MSIEFAKFWLLLGFGICFLIEQSVSDRDYDESHDPRDSFDGEDPEEDSNHSDDEGHHDSDYDHDLVTGSHEDSEEYKNLDPEESKKRLGELVKKMDTDNNGKLTKEELQAWIVNSLKNLDKEKAEHQMLAMDENDDKIITWPEMTHREFGYSPEEIKELSNDTSESNKKFLKTVDLQKLRFDLADADKNGNLSATEFIAFAKPYNVPHMANFVVHRTLMDFDSNDDNMINQTEFMGDVKLHFKELQSEQKRFEKFDKNKDGQLDKFEMVTWLMPGYEKLAGFEVKHLFEETDKDKDQVLSAQEILDQSDLWVGSQATDYGKHLDSEFFKHNEL